MRFRLSIAAGAAALLSVWGVFAASARPLTPAEQRYARWQAVAPACDNFDVIERVRAHFQDSEGTYWGSDAWIKDFQNIRETAFRPNGIDYIPRRYCAATAIFEGHSSRPIFYAIVEDMGMVGTDIGGSVMQSLTFGLFTSTGVPPVSVIHNWGVEWCVDGLDRNYAFGPHCRALRPAGKNKD